jgi:hypothetical protein
MDHSPIIEPMAAPARIDASSLPSLLSALEQHALIAQLDDWQRYILAEQLAAAVYPRFKFSEHGRLWLEDEAFFRDYGRTMDAGNWHSCDRKYMLKELARRAATLAGDFAECGVYRGGSALLMCQQATTGTSHVHLFDSFEGLPSPGEHDGSYWEAGRFTCSMDTTLATLSGLNNFTCYKGWIPDRFAEVSGRAFSLVHIDVDLHDPTRQSLEFFYPRLVPGGVIVLDDHGFESCPGARKAALDYFADKPDPVLDLPTGQGLVIRQGKAGWLAGLGRLIGRLVR